MKSRWGKLTTVASLVARPLQFVPIRCYASIGLLFPWQPFILETFCITSLHTLSHKHFNKSIFTIIMCLDKTFACLNLAFLTVHLASVTIVTK